MATELYPDAVVASADAGKPPAALSFSADRNQLVAYLKQVREEHPHAKVTVHASVDQERNKIVVEIQVEIPSDAAPVAHAPVSTTPPVAQAPTLLNGLLAGFKDMIITVTKVFVPAPAPPKVFKHFHEAFDYVRDNSGKPCEVTAISYTGGKQTKATFTITRSNDADGHWTYAVRAVTVSDKKPVLLSQGDRGTNLYSLPKAQQIVRTWHTL